MDVDTNLDKSVMVIEEGNQTIVTIDDSEEEEEACIVDDEQEEGEVVGDEETDENYHYLFQVNFKDHTIFDLYKTLLVQALENAFKVDNNCIKMEIDDHELRLLAYASENSEAHTNESNVTEIKRNRKSKSKSPDLTGIKELFTIDPLPSDKPDFVQVPSYKRSIKHVLDEESVASKRQKTEDMCQRSRPSASCFNCGAKDHSMRECPKPRNMKRIQNARKSFKRCSDQRYHLQEGPYPHLRPGVISPHLKKALGLRSGDLPFFFYRMRVLGYPPGWLEDAKVKHSGLTLFSADGSKDACEKDENAHITRDKYDVSKIIDFPGFNVKPTNKFYDDFKYHNVPPMNVNHMKGEFVKSLGDNVIKSYKRKKITNFPIENDISTSDVVCLEPTDMEVVDTDDEVIEITEDNESQEITTVNSTEENCENVIIINEPENNNDLTDEATTDAPSDKNAEMTKDTRTPSPTIADLEERQNALLAALGDETAKKELLKKTAKKTGKDANVVHASEEKYTEVTAEEKNTEEVAAEEKNTEEVAAKEKNTEELAAKEKTEECVQAPLRRTSIEPIIKETHVGTPLLKFSPFDKLPSGDKFKVGVSDVINFENLPDSTGKYEQMKVVIKKVRNTVKKLHAEDD